MDRTAASEIAVRDFLRQHKKPLLDAWFQRILDSFPAETASFLKRQTDRFANPVAHGFREAAETIFDSLLGDRELDRGSLEYAMKIQALRGNQPNDGVAFIYLLNDTVREKLDGSLLGKGWIDFESRVDRIASIASEMFLASRTKIAELAAKNAPVGKMPQGRPSFEAP